MSCENSTAEALKNTGQRLTPQRLMILSAIRHNQGHISVSDIFDQVRESYPFLDISTVYRTLGVLKQMRLVSETDMGGGEYRYEWIDTQRHHHLVCRGCSGVVELDHEYLASLSAEILAGYGFQSDVDHFAIFGLCSACQSTRNN